MPTITKHLPRTLAVTCNIYRAFYNSILHISTRFVPPALSPYTGHYLAPRLPAPTYHAPIHYTLRAHYLAAFTVLPNATFTACSRSAFILFFSRTSGYASFRYAVGRTTSRVGERHGMVLHLSLPGSDAHTNTSTKRRPRRFGALYRQKNILPPFFCTCLPHEYLYAWRVCRR